MLVIGLIKARLAKAKRATAAMRRALDRTGQLAAIVALPFASFNVI